MPLQNTVKKIWDKVMCNHVFDKYDGDFAEMGAQYNVQLEKKAAALDAILAKPESLQRLVEIAKFSKSLKTAINAHERDFDSKVKNVANYEVAKNRKVSNYTALGAFAVFWGAAVLSGGVLAIATTGTVLFGTLMRGMFSDINISTNPILKKYEWNGKLNTQMKEWDLEAKVQKVVDATMKTDFSQFKSLSNKELNTIFKSLPKLRKQFDKVTKMAFMSPQASVVPVSAKPAQPNTP